MQRLVERDDTIDAAAIARRKAYMSSIARKATDATADIHHQKAIVDTLNAMGTVTIYSVDDFSAKLEEAN